MYQNIQEIQTSLHIIGLNESSVHTLGDKEVICEQQRHSGVYVVLVLHNLKVH